MSDDPLNGDDRLTVGAARRDKPLGSTAAQPLYWIGDPPKTCDLGGEQITLAFVDGRIRGRTTWANMCLYCARVYGAGTRPGNGQLYQRQPDGRFLKVAG